jgi:hypothetical protein
VQLRGCPARSRSSRASRLGRWSRSLAAAAACVSATSGFGERSAQAADDPYQQYWTIKTPHFRVHYAKNIEKIAERVADLCEDAHGRLVPVLGHSPDTPTDVVLTDNTEAANGSATALPYNVVRLYVTAPDDMSPLADYEDWYLELVTHEYTHILHTDNISGVPAILNAVFGKSIAPNQFQPRWILEGLAVLEESKFTAGGRNRSAIFDMYLRADVLEDHLARLDQFTHGPRRWPMGNLWYLYGSRFLTWIESVYGEQTMRAVSEDYSHQLMPFGVNRSIRRATGRTYEELFDGWKRHLKTLYGEQMARVKNAPMGLVEGTRLTQHGRDASRPRWVPAAARRDPQTPELVYHLDDGHHRPGFHRMLLPSFDRANEASRELFVRTNGQTSLSFDRFGAVVFNTTEIHKRIYGFSDLSRLPPNVSSEDGDEPERHRLSEGLRALDPDVRRDGKEVAYTINRRGTQFLAVSELNAEGGLGTPRVLFPTPSYQLAQTPRYSPDGKTIATSVWEKGGFRDIWLVDVATGNRRALTHDRALDLQPSWSPDGKTVYFSSDRTGIHNIYAYDLATEKTHQVTNVRTGAFMPEVAPEGDHLVYVGYGTNGFDLYGLAIDRSKWQTAPTYLDDRPPPNPAPAPHDWERAPYNPFPGLRPRAISAKYGPGNYGQTLTLTTVGNDPVGRHGLFGVLALDGAHAAPQASLSYSYGRLPFDYGLTAFRYIGPRKGSYSINGEEPAYDEVYYGIVNSLSYSKSRAFDYFSWGVSYTGAVVGAELPVPAARTLDPTAETGRDPSVRGFLGIARAGFYYSNIERYLYSVGNSRGFAFSLNADYASRETASDYDFFSVGYSLQKFMQTPWHPDHTIVLAAQSSISGGTYPRRDTYYVGGFVTTPPLDAFGNNFFQSGFLLRGYPPYVYAGRQYHLGTAEYRLPLLHPERGVSTLPAFLNRISAAAFVDYGTAVDFLDPKRWRELFHTAVGAELLFDTTLGYYVSTTTRLGYAKGFSSEAYPGGKIYFVISTPY